MPAIGPRCYELRVNDETKTWRIIYRIDPDAIVLCEVFEKKTPCPPQKYHRCLPATPETV